MLPGQNQASFNSLVGKTVMGALGAGLLVLAVFHQPWIPVEISRAETGVLAAMPAPARAVPLSPTFLSPAQPADRQDEPIDVPLLSPSDEMPNSVPSPFVQTAEAAPPAAVSDPSTEWQLGKPTVAYQLPRAFQIPVSESGVIWNFVIPTGVDRDLYLTGAELRPGNTLLVQRMILSYDPSGTARLQDQDTPEPGFSSSDFARPLPTFLLAEWRPDLPLRFALQATARRIPAGADLVLTVEYAATADVTSDPWSMGLHLTRSAPDAVP
jgi:hypothetical protein